MIDSPPYPFESLRRAAFRSYLTLTTPALRVLADLHHAESMDGAGLEQLRQERLARLLSHAHGHVPSYRRLLAAAGVTRATPDAVVRAFRSLPVLEKSTIRANFDDLKSSDLPSRRWFSNRSSGSTGEPISVIQDADHSAAGVALKLLFDEWAGYRPGQRKAVIWNTVRNIRGGRDPIRTRVGRFVRNEWFVPTESIQRATLKAFAARLDRFRPRLLFGYAGAIQELARLMEADGVSVRPVPAVMSSANILFPKGRATLARVFSAPVFNRYGSVELADLASECDRHRGLHVSPATHLIEVVREDGSPAAPGEEGDVVVTLFTNLAMPLIRYRLGDRAVLTDRACDCGRQSPMLSGIVGRSHDRFIQRDGQLIRTGSFTHLLQEFAWVARYQVIQEDFEFVRIRLQPVDPGADSRRQHAANLQELEALTRKLVGAACQVEFDFVDEIVPEDGRKNRFIFSRLTDGQPFH